jgi:hypothetical protein
MYVCMYVCMYVYMRVVYMTEGSSGFNIYALHTHMHYIYEGSNALHTHIILCVYVCMYVCIYVCMYVCM